MTVNQRMNWRNTLTARVLGGTATITPRAQEHLARLEAESPRMHQRVTDYILGWDYLDVEVELGTLVWITENWWYKPEWKRTCKRMEGLPEWFLAAYRHD